MPNLPFKRSIKESGQALLIILLVMSVALTVVLSIIARTVTDVTISKSQDDSIRAFNAAEAGIEKAIIGGEMTGHLISGAQFTTTITDTGNSGTNFLYPIDIDAGESATFWFVSHTVINNEEMITCTTGNCVRPLPIVVCWGGDASIDATTPAILVEIYYNSDTVNDTEWDIPTRDFSEIKVLRFTSDPNVIRRSNSNNFSQITPGNCNIGTKTLSFGRRIFLNGGGGPNDESVILPGWNSMSPGSIIMAKVHMLYNSDVAHPIGITIGGGNLPLQGKLIQSTGVSADNYRKLSVFQGYPELPFAFNSAIFSGGDISK